MMRSFTDLTELATHVGTTLGTSPWITVDQRTLDLFAEATGDNQWIHVDVARAKREMPGGKTIAHGYLTLALLPRLVSSVYEVRQCSRRVNYGSNKVRFVAPVMEGARLRLSLTLQSAERIAEGYRLTFGNTIEIEGDMRPALVAETISIAYD